MATQKVQNLVYTLETVTPAQAAHWLKYNNNTNRPYSKSHMYRFSLAMTRGAWKTTQEAISFDWDNNLANGQHRLAAMVHSGKTLSLIICRGANPANFPFIDRVKPRGAADALALMGVLNSVVTSSAVRVLACLLERKVDTARNMESDLVCDAYLANEKHLSPFTEQKVQKIPGASIAALALVHMKYPKQAEYCYARLRDGVGLSTGSSIRHLREWLNKAAPRGSEAQYCQSMMTLTALKHYISGSEIRLLKLGHDPETLFDFFSTSTPELKGAVVPEPEPKQVKAAAKPAAKPPLAKPVVKLAK